MNHCQSPKPVKSLKEIQNELAKEYGHANWSAVKNKFRVDSLDVSSLIAFCNEANKRFYSQSVPLINLLESEQNKS